MVFYFVLLKQVMCQWQAEFISSL